MAHFVQGKPVFDHDARPQPGLVRALV